MEVYQSIWANCDTTQLEKHSQLISESVFNLGLFQNEDMKLLKSHVGEINSLLNSPKTRDRGLRLLADVVVRCSDAVLSDQCKRWFKYCSDAVAAGRRTRSLTQACQVLTFLLQQLNTLPELQRHVSAKATASLVLDLAAADHERNPAALKCLYEYVMVAPGPCLQHKKTLEEHILHHLDAPSTRDSTARLAGRVYAALPLPGVGGGNVHQTRAEARGRQLTGLLALAHSIMDYLLDGVIEKDSPRVMKDSGRLHVRPLEDISTDPVVSRLAAIARLSNTIKFVGEMITDSANPAITLTFYELLSVPFRLLQVEVSVLARYKSHEHRLLAFFLESLHHQSLLLLRDIITSLGEGIDIYFGVLGNLLLSVVQGSEARVKGKTLWSNAGERTRVVAYAVLAELLRASHGRHAPQADLVTLVLRDARPVEGQVKLQKQGRGLRSLSVQKAAGKKRGYIVTSGEPNSNLEGQQNKPGPSSDLARVALVVAEMVFTHASHSIAQTDHQRLQVGVLAIAEMVTGAASPPYIYQVARTRAQLFHTLASLSASPHPLCPPPYSQLSHLFMAGLSDDDTQVVSVCQSALCCLSLIVANPRVELPSRVFQQHSLHLSNTQEEEEKEEDHTLQEEEEEEEEENKEEEEEPMLDDKRIENSQEEMQEEEEEEKKTEENKEEEEEEEEEEEKREKEEEENNEEMRDTKEEEEKNEEMRDTKEGDREKEEETCSTLEGKEEKTEVQIKNTRETKKGRGGRAKSGRRENDPPAKKVKVGEDKGSGKRNSKELTVEEMLLDFVG